MKLRIRIAQVCNASSPLFGEVEVDESYFGARRVRGKKGRGAGGKPIVFGILERHGKVSEIVPDASRKKLQSAIRGQAALEASSTRTAGEATMGWWTWATKRISECITGCIMVSMSLPAVIAISMALSHSVHMLNGGLQSSILFPDKRSFYTSRNVNSDFITERRLSDWTQQSIPTSHEHPEVPKVPLHRSPGGIEGDPRRFTRTHPKAAQDSRPVKISLIEYLLY